MTSPDPHAADIAPETAVPPADEEEYLLGTGDDELVRLGFQHQMWSAQAHAVWERAGFGPGQRLLDVGCGPGYATFDLADLVGPGGAVTGVDASPRFVAHVRAQARARGAVHVRAQVGDAERLEDVPEGAFDGAYARWVLCFVSDPEAAVAAVARALKPGGRFVVKDYVHYQGLMLAPEDPAFAKAIRAVVASWRAAGDPNVGATLPTLMERHGLEPVHVAPLVRIARPGTALWKWPETFFRNYLPTLVEPGLLSQEDVEDFFRLWEARTADPASFFLTPPMVEIVAVKR